VALIEPSHAAMDHLPESAYFSRPMNTTIVGNYISPYVRKVLVCLELKGVAYQLDPIVPFFGNDEFGRISPIRRIPVLIDDEVTLSDSTVICEYLEERYPQPALYPATRAARARARWLEEYADTRMGEVLIWRYFNQLLIRRVVWGEPKDAALVQRVVEVEAPQIFDYLEGQLPREGYLFQALSVADIAIAAVVRNALMARFVLDEARWPITAAHIWRTLDQPCFVKLRTFEELSLRTPIAEQRAALIAAGAPIAPTTLGTQAPRRGMMNL
jgi:glutathione S-transferase